VRVVKVVKVVKMLAQKAVKHADGAVRRFVQATKFWEIQPTVKRTRFGLASWARRGRTRRETSMTLRGRAPTTTSSWRNR
jgi:hypothetical protein